MTVDPALTDADGWIDRNAIARGRVDCSCGFEGVSDLLLHAGGVTLRKRSKADGWAKPSTRGGHDGALFDHGCGLRYFATESAMLRAMHSSVAAEQTPEGGRLRRALVLGDTLGTAVPSLRLAR